MVARAKFPSLQLGLADFNLTYGFEEVSIKSLQVDKSYQRGETSLINVIAGQFDPLAFGIVWVGMRSDGKKFIVDGLQRTRGAEKAGHSKVPALVFRSEGRKQEADIFRKLNAFRRRVSRMDVFRSANEAKLEYAVNITSAVRSAGLKIATRDSRGTREAVWPNIKAIAALEEIYDQSGKSGVADTAETVVLCWNEQVDALRQESLKAVHKFRWAYGVTLDLDRMEAKLSAKPMSGILIDADSEKHRQQRRGILLPKFECIYDRLRKMYGKKVPVRSLAHPEPAEE